MKVAKRILLTLVLSEFFVVDASMNRVSRATNLLNQTKRYNGDFVQKPAATNLQPNFANSSIVQFPKQKIKLEVPKLHESALQQQAAALEREGFQAHNHGPKKGESLAKWLVGSLGFAAGYGAYQEYQDRYDFGEIDKEMEPNFKQAVIYLRKKLQDLPLEEGFDIEMLAFKVSKNYLSYKTMDLGINLLKKRVKQDVSYKVSMQDFDDLIDNLMLGRKITANELLQKFNYVQDKKYAAYHEAGHALIYALFLSNMRFLDYVTIENRINASETRGTGGFNTVYSLLHSKNNFIERIKKAVHDFKYYKMKLINLFAGGIASLYSSQDLKKLNITDFDKFIEISGVSGDVDQIQALADKMVPVEMFLQAVNAGIDSDEFANYSKDHDAWVKNSEEKNQHWVDLKNQILEETLAKTVELIEEHQDELEKIAELLLEKETVSGDEIYELVGGQRPMLHFEYDRIVDEFEKYYDYV